MINGTVDEVSELHCHACGYDLRAQAPDAKCPECGEPVAESIQQASMPRRPAWRDADPRWRRRMLAGVWILALLPLKEAMEKSGMLRELPAPNVFGFRGWVSTLDETLLFSWGVFEPVMFCIGSVLLFARERGRRPSRLDWTRRWGVICGYVIAFLGAVQVLFISALVLAGIAAVFQSMPLGHHPPITSLFVEVSYGYLRYGPFPQNSSLVVMIVFSSIIMLLACVPLYEALRSTGLKRVAIILLLPIAGFALSHLWRLALSDPEFTLFGARLFRNTIYFEPRQLVNYFWDVNSGPDEERFNQRMEALKWGLFMFIALWLTVARWWKDDSNLRHEIPS